MSNKTSLFMLWHLCKTVMLGKIEGKRRGWRTMRWLNGITDPMDMFSSVQFSHSVVSNSLRPHEPQHTRPPCPSPTTGVHAKPRPLSRWCHPIISSSAVPFSSCSQTFLASGSFQMSQLFPSGGQSIEVSPSTSVLPMNTQDWSPLGLVGSPRSPGDSQESSPTPQFKSIRYL